MGFLIPPHFSNKFWNKKKYYKNQSRFNGVFLRNNLPKKLKDGAYVINLDEYADVGTHWFALFCNTNEIVYLDSFGVEHIPEEIKEFIEEFPGDKNMKTNIFWEQANDSVWLLLHKIDWFYVSR